MTNPELRERLHKVIRNSDLWEACVLEAYEGDVDNLIENILFSGFTIPSTVPQIDREKLAKLISDTYRPYAGTEIFNNYDIATAIINALPELMEQI